MRQLVLPCLLVACATAPIAPASNPDAEPGLRLSTSVVPTLIRLQLTVDPKAEKLPGVADLEVTLANPASTIWVNAGELTFTKGEAIVGERHIPAQLKVGEEHVGFTFASPIAAGKVTLHLEYTGGISSKDNDGVFRESVGDDRYVFSHFEPFHARRAFPCFDEPFFKPAWQVTLRVPKGDEAFNNSPLLERTDDADGLQTFRFAPTPPLPSYLVSLAVGPLVRLDDGKAGQNGTPMGVIVPRGLEDQARFPMQAGPRILEILEDYFGTPYPYAKLDLVSIPLYGGATENPGLIVFAQRIFLSKPADETINFRRVTGSVMAHELSHLWVGDLVTNAWWDDIWLNEAFATWMADKVIEKFAPDWGAAEERVQSRGQAMGADSLLTARQIRQPITSKHDIKNSFDGITYTKGAAVLAMYEQYLGPKVFQAGVRRYLAAHANSTATTADFLAALSAEAGRDVSPSFSTFLDQPGVPLVEVKLECTPAASYALLAQQRYLPAGVDMTPTLEAQRWQIPVCVRWSANGTEGRDCTVSSESHDRLKLTSPSCPDWLLPNAGASGYYRSRMASDLLDKVLAPTAKITTVERLGMVGDAEAQVRAGQMPIDLMLARVPQLAGDVNRFVVGDAVDLAGLLHNQALVPTALHEKYVSFLDKTFDARLEALGWKAAPGEPEDFKILRSSLLSLLGRDADDAALIAEARRRADAWLADHNAVDPDLVGAVLSITAAHGDRALFDRWHQVARGEKDQRTRARLLGAMGSFRDPEVLKAALMVMLTDEFEIRESLSILFGAIQEPDGRPIAWDFVKEHFDALAAKMPRDFPANLPWVAAALCDDSRRAEIEAFFKDRMTQYAGGPRQLAQAMESMHQCSVFRRVQQPAVEKFLAK